MFNFFERKTVESKALITDAPPRSTWENICKDVSAQADPELAKNAASFHNTNESDSTDIFLGVAQSLCKQIAQKYAQKCSFDDLARLLDKKEHEIKLAALMILIEKYRAQPKQAYEFYFKHLNAITSWDLVDLTASAIIGDYLYSHMAYPREDLYRLARSQNTWDRRIAIVATLSFVKNDDFADAFKIAHLYFNEQSPLVLKAAGKVLREIGKRNKHALIEFIAHNQTDIPREMLNTAATNLSPALKKTIRKETKIQQKQ